MKITIITISCNSELTITKSIQSVLSQNNNCEYIIIDGNSIDKTVMIINRYETYIQKYISEKDNGIYDAMNKGLNLATGDVIGFLNSDDYYMGSDVLDAVLHIFENADFDSCYSDLVYVDQGYKPVRYWKSGQYSLSKFYWGWMPPHPTFFVKKKIFERYGGFDTDFGTAADYELMLRFLLKYRISCTYIPQVLVCMRTGGASNASISGRLLANRYDRSAWKKNELTPFPWTLALKPLRKIGQYFFKKTVVSNASVP